MESGNNIASENANMQVAISTRIALVLLSLRQNRARLHRVLRMQQMPCRKLAGVNPGLSSNAAFEAATAGVPAAEKSGKKSLHRPRLRKAGAGTFFCRRCTNYKVRGRRSVIAATHEQEGKNGAMKRARRRAS